MPSQSMALSLGTYSYLHDDDIMEKSDFLTALVVTRPQRQFETTLGPGGSARTYASVSGLAMARGHRSHFKAVSSTLCVAPSLSMVF